MRGQLFEITPQPLREAKALLAGQNGVLGVQVFGDRLHIWVEDGGLDESALSELLTSRNITVESIRQTVPGLEDVFMSMVTEERVMSVPNDKPAVEVHDLVKRFGSFTAVDHVSFSVPRGEIFGFLGSNGAGKSTTIRMLCGLLLPTSGTGSVAGF